MLRKFGLLAGGPQAEAPLAAAPARNLLTLRNAFITPSLSEEDVQCGRVTVLHPISSAKRRMCSALSCYPCKQPVSCGIMWITVLNATRGQAHNRMPRRVETSVIFGSRIASHSKHGRLALSLSLSVSIACVLAACISLTLYIYIYTCIHTYIYIHTSLSLSLLGMGTGQRSLPNAS